MRCKIRIRRVRCENGGGDHFHSQTPVANAIDCLQLDCPGRYRYTGRFINLIRRETIGEENGATRYPHW